MGKGSVRRPENTKAIEANWPWPDRRPIDLQKLWDEQAPKPETTPPIISGGVNGDS